MLQQQHCTTKSYAALLGVSCCRVCQLPWESAGKPPLATFVRGSVSRYQTVTGGDNTNGLLRRGQGVTTCIQG
jgi:hypothetical protein